MTAYEVVSLNKELLKRLHKIGIKTDDYKWLGIYGDYVRMNFRDHNEEIEQAYKDGYTHGWKDHEREMENDIANYMIALGATSGDVDEALDVLFGQMNAGMCVTNSPLRMSLIFIGDADSAEQWWDTLTHELYHAQQAICGYYGVDVGSEDGAWTMGYLMRKAVEILAAPCV